MVKGREQHQAREHALALLGKDLARRARSQCELCGAKGVSLHIFEVDPVPKEPSLEHSILICSTCEEQINSPKTRDPHHWRCLSSAVWSEVLPAQVQALVVLDQLLDNGVAQDWAQDLKDTLYIEPETQAWLDSL